MAKQSISPRSGDDEAPSATIVNLAKHVRSAAKRSATKPVQAPAADPVTRAANDPDFAGTPEGQAALEAAAKEAKIARAKAKNEPKPKAEAAPEPATPELRDLLKTVKGRRADVVWAKNKVAAGTLAQEKLDKRQKQYDDAIAAYTAAGGEYTK